MVFKTLISASNHAFTAQQISILCPKPGTDWHQTCNCDCSEMSSSSSSPPKIIPENNNDEESLIQELKKSLKITENEFLESEIEDLKEFFTVELTETNSNDCEFDCQAFWLKVSLPITFRKILKDGKEVLKDEIPEISIKIKLKSGKFVAEEQLKEGKNEQLEELEGDNLTKDSIDEKSVEKDNCDIMADNSTVNSTVDSLEQEINSEEVNEQSKDSLPYEFSDFTVSPLEDSLNEEKTRNILKELVEEKDLSLLSVVEEFYIKLEDVNYPHKTVTCRDYYYPVFDGRHWGRFCKTSNSSHQSTNSSINDQSGSNSVTYRARALYDFQALMQGELSFQENEVLIVLANLGNGWLTARRTSTSKECESINNNNNTTNNTTNNTSKNETANDDTFTGLIPENYIERL